MMPTSPDCIDCGDPGAGSCHENRCRDCDLEHAWAQLKCDACGGFAPNVGVALRIFGLRSEHAEDCPERAAAIEREEAVLARMSAEEKEKAAAKERRRAVRAKNKAEDEAREKAQGKLW